MPQLGVVEVCWVRTFGDDGLLGVGDGGHDVVGVALGREDRERVLFGSSAEARVVIPVPQAKPENVWSTFWPFIEGLGSNFLNTACFFSHQPERVIGSHDGQGGHVWEPDRGGSPCGDWDVPAGQLGVARHEGEGVSA